MEASFRSSSHHSWPQRATACLAFVCILLANVRQKHSFTSFHSSRIGLAACSSVGVEARGGLVAVTVNECGTQDDHKQESQQPSWRCHQEEELLVIISHPFTIHLSHQHIINTQKRWLPRSVWLPPGRPATPLPARAPRPPPCVCLCAACPLRAESIIPSPTPWTDLIPRR